MIPVSALIYLFFGTAALVDGILNARAYQKTGNELAGMFSRVGIGVGITMYLYALPNIFIPAQSSVVGLFYLAALFPLFIGMNNALAISLRAWRMPKLERVIRITVPITTAGYFLIHLTHIPQTFTDMYGLIHWNVAFPFNILFALFLIALGIIPAFFFASIHVVERKARLKKWFMGTAFAAGSTGGMGVVLLSNTVLIGISFFLLFIGGAGVAATIFATVAVKTTWERYQKDLQPLKKGFDLLRDHVIITDKDSRILYANKAAEEKTGYSISEMIGKTPGRLWGGHMPKEFYDAMWHTIKEKKKPFTGEVKNIARDGTVRWQEIHVVPIFDNDGALEFFVGIEPDITDKKRQEKFRQEIAEILKDQLAEPIINIQWALRWLSENSPLTHTQKTILETAYIKSGSLNALIQDLVILTRIGTVKEQKELFDLTDIITACMTPLKNTYPGHSFSFQKEGSSSFPLISSKDGALKIFSTIIENAADYTELEKGIIAITLKKLPRAYLFSCQDNGIGISKQEQARVFTKFFRAANAQQHKPGKIGLGLFIAHMIADGLRWNITFRSKEDSGSTFSVQIPLP